MRSVSSCRITAQWSRGRPSQDGPAMWRQGMQPTNNNSLPPCRQLSARRVALLATTIVGFGAVALLAAPSVAPKFDLFGAPAQAQNLSEKAQQLGQKPIGFA